MENFILYKGAKIHFTDSGEGITIVLIHGYLESAEIWSGLALKLSERYRVITVDLPGHGSSDNFGEVYTMEIMAGMIKHLLDELGLIKAFLTGHSLGGYLSLAFLELFPDRLSGYCLFHSHPFPDTSEAVEKRMREIKIVNAGKKDLVYIDNIPKMFGNDNLVRLPDAIIRSKEIASRITPGGITGVLKGMIGRPSRLSFMEEGRVPCLWILGAMDNYIPCETIQNRVNLPVNAEVVVLKNSGHLGFIEEEELTLDILYGFLGKLKS